MYAAIKICGRSCHFLFVDKSRSRGQVRGCNYPFLTSKERDIETGLDYFLARYYSSTQGRFTSPDEFTGGPHELWVLGSGDPEKQALVYADVTNPQSLNKYQYTFNNPLRYVDPDGRVPQDLFDIGFQKLQEDRSAGKITEQQYWEALRAAGVGAAVGLALVAASRGGGVSVIALWRWAQRNPDRAAQITQEMVQASSGNPSPANLTPGAMKQALGLAREAQVATIVGGKVARQEVTVKGLGSTDIDVIGGAREYIAVGGPAKTASSVGRQLQILQEAAKQAGVKAVAYFEKGTHESVLKVARKRLGAENVHIFEDAQ